MTALPRAIRARKGERLRGKSYSYREGDTRKQHSHDCLPTFVGRIMSQPCHSFCDGGHEIAIYLRRPRDHKSSHSLNFATGKGVSCFTKQRPRHTLPPPAGASAPCILGRLFNARTHVPTTGIITQLSTTDGKHLRAKMHICGPLCGYGGWWFSPRRHRQLVSYRDRKRRPPV